MKKLLKIALIVLAVVFGLSLIVSVTAHIVVSTAISKKLNRDISLSMVYVNPVTGAVYLRGLHCTEQDKQSPFVNAKSLYVRINPYALALRQVRIGTIETNGLYISVVNQDTCFNFSDIPERFKSKKPETEPEEKGKPWAIHLSDISLQKSNVVYTEPSKSNKWHIADFDLSIPGIHLADNNSAAGISIDFPHGSGSLQLKGKYNDASQNFAIAVRTQGLDVKHAFPIIKQHLNIYSLDADIDADMTVQGSVNDPMTTTLKGMLTINDISLNDTRWHTAMECPQMHVNVKSIALKNMLVDIEKISVDSLAFDIINEKDANTISDIFKKPADVKDTQETKADSQEPEENKGSVNSQLAENMDKLRVRIGNLDIKRCAVNYEDKTLPSDFKYRVTGISIQGKEVDTKSVSNHIVVSGTLPSGGSMMVNWRGALNPMKSNSRIVAMLRNMKIKDMSPWTEYMFGYPLQSGSLSITSDNTIMHGKLDATEQIDIHRPEVGKKKKRFTPVVDNVPLKLALNLLTNPQGNINMEVPIAGDLKSPSFSLKDVIGKAIGQILLKATAAPFVAMAQAHNRNDDLSFIDININMPDFSLDQYAKLDLIAEMMEENKDINLRLTQQYNINSAAMQFAVFKLKSEFYEYQTDKIGELTLIDYQKIDAIKENNRDFQNYCKTRLSSRGSLQQKALAYYGSEKIVEELSQAAERRNKFVAAYLTDRKGIDDGRINVITAPKETLRTYKGKNQYSVEAVIEDD